MKKLLATCLLSTALLVGCSGDEEESADVEGCEHLQNGPSTPVTATPTLAGIPAVSNDHRRYDVTLVDVGSQKGGSVTFAASEATDYVFFLSEDMQLLVEDSSGEYVDPEEFATGSSECSEVERRYVFPLSVGTYRLSFGPSSAASVSIVIEEAAHEHDHEH